MQCSVFIALHTVSCSVHTFCPAVNLQFPVCLFSVVHTVFALRWIPAGSLSADAHLHRGSGGWEGGIQTDMHTQTDRWIRTSQTRLDVQRNTQRRMNLHICLQKAIDWCIDLFYRSFQGKTAVPPEGRHDWSLENQVWACAVLSTLQSTPVNSS